MSVADPKASPGASAANLATVSAGKRTVGQALLHIVSNHGLFLLAILFVIAYAILLPDTFLTKQTFRAIMAASVIVSFLSLSEMIVVASNNYDLSIAYNLGLSHIIVMGLLTRTEIPWYAVVAIVIAMGALIGLINGLLVEYAKIDSFIATLGVGTILYGLGAWYTNGAQLVGDLPPMFTGINDTTIFNVPLPAILVAILVVALWVVFEFLPIGRQIYAIGGNRKAAELTGVPARRIVIAVFVVSGAIVGFAGVVLAARLRVGQTAVGPEFLLPAFVGALLGSTTIRPGRVNALGTMVAVLVLAIGIAGLQQLGGGFYVEPIFQGASLILSVGLAGYAARRRREGRSA
ncbi:monosaccharide ABC transporter membrane protein (CUT2 family) [Roseiarcus fermentans]|uniref:Autoinducer 2 import system permease protein LsrD n=2 Tax=Roseiarcus fermentans TaxID=1473586 RepID=A0A366FVC6_9HYPH|nr:monosaccharide ABC transporter membrane protein (CUT2 family) [Roseiarcus fermentans]